jgi:hypothetical protein
VPLCFLIEQNHELGVFISGSDAASEASVVRATELSSDDTRFGDGITAIDHPDPSAATVSATEVTDNARAGLLFVNSTGSIEGVLSSRNRFGLVLQREGKPTLVGGNVFEGNTEQNKLVGGDLPVPAAAAPLPCAGGVRMRNRQHP